MTTIAPDPAALVALRIGFKPAFALAPELFIEGTRVLPVEATGASFSAWVARAGVTWEFLDAGILALGVVGSGEFGSVHAVGADSLRRPQTDDHPWGAANLGLSLRVPASSMFFVRLEVGGFVTFFRHEYLITTPTNMPAEVHTIGDIGFRGSGFVGFFL
jgi:hypothetical protein